MKAALIRRFGSPDVLEIADVAAPAPQAGDVVVRNHATSVNPVDCYLRAGGLRRFASVPFPIVPGVDLSGVVERPGTSQFFTGEEVFGFIPSPRQYGAYADLCACDPGWLATKPASLSHVETAALPCVGLTALQALRDKARLTAGQSVLVVGASGGVGTMAVQIARNMGLDVTGVCSAANVGLVRSLGASDVIDYNAHDPRCQSRRYDAVFDCVGAYPFQAYRTLLTRRGIHVGISGTRAATIDSLISRLRPGPTSFQFHVRAATSDLRQLADWVDQGMLKPIISRVLPLSTVAEGHRLSEGRHTVGKIAVEVRHPGGEVTETGA